MTTISRRTLLTHTGAGLVLGGAASALVLPDAAEAKVTHDSRVRTYGKVAILGDSSSGGYLNGLNTTLAGSKVGPYRYDIRGSRRITESWLTYDSGLKAAQTMKASGYNPKAWVVALGSNDFYFFRRKLLSPRKEIEAVLDELGTNRHVAWFTIWTKRAGAYHSTFNGVLYDLAAKHPRLHVIEWAAVAKKNPQWLMDDGAHLKMPGAKARNTYLARAAVIACKKAGAVH